MLKLDQLRQIGPGLVYALAVLGTGDVVSNSTAGASYGYSLIWALALACTFRFVWSNSSAKYVLVTGESLLQGYARMGRWVLWILFFSVLFIGHISTMIQIVMFGNVAHLLLPLPISWSSTLWSLIIVLLGFSMVFWGGYRTIERFCRILVAVMGVSLAVIAVVSRPDPAAILKGTLIPSLPAQEGLYSSFLVVMALIGTSAAAGDITYSYFVRARGWVDVSYLKQQRTDLAVGLISMFLMGSLLQIAAAATIHPLGIDLEEADDLVRVFSEAQGLLGWFIFILGLLGASFSTFVGLATGYSLIVADIAGMLFEGRRPGEVESGDVRRKPAYRASVAFCAFSPLYILLTGLTPVFLVLSLNALFLFLVPILTPLLLKITNDRSRMGEYRNGWISNAILGLSFVLALYLSAVNVAEMFL